MTQPVDSSILHEIVRVIELRAKVPERVRVRGREYQLAYLDDHKQRLEEALRRHDRDRVNMLYGQLTSKVKYQLLRRIPSRQTGAATRKVTAARKVVALERKPTAKEKLISRKGKSAVLKKPRVIGKKGVATARRPVSRAARG